MPVDEVFLTAAVKTITSHYFLQWRVDFYSEYYHFLLARMNDNSKEVVNPN